MFFVKFRFFCPGFVLLLLLFWPMVVLANNPLCDRDFDGDPLTAEQKECLRKTCDLYNYTHTTTVFASVPEMINRSLIVIRLWDENVIRKLDEVSRAIAVYNTNPNPTRADVMVIWDKFNRAELALNWLNGGLTRAWNTNVWCQDPATDGYFRTALERQIRRQLDSMVRFPGPWWDKIDDYTRQLNDLRRRMPGFLIFGDFLYRLPGITGTIDEFVKNPNPILRYMNIVIIMVIAGIVAIALIMIVVAGYMYVTAGGNAQRVTTAKSLIGAALLGIVLVLGAFLILNTIGTQFASELQEPTIDDDYSGDGGTF